MRLTSSFAVFRYDPGEKALAKARWYAREGKSGAAEDEYRAALAQDPDLVTGWLELFELLRRQGKPEAALAIAKEAALRFGSDAAMPLALEGAALAELGRTPDAMRSLERAIERDGNLALAWHELGYAAFRGGEFSRALLALDRAFALEPHTDTLMLRGRILREAGQYEAAEVAFEGAHQSAEHDIPRRDAEREIAATRRAATLGGKRPKEFTVRELAFAELGAVLLEDGSGGDFADLLSRCLAAFPRLVEAMDWRPAAVAGVRPADQPLVHALARWLGAHPVSAVALDPADRPLIATAINDGDEEWSKVSARLARWQCGVSFALTQRAGAPEVTEVADVIGTLRGPGEAAVVYQAMTAALAAPASGAPVDPEVLALARNPLAQWRSRLAPADREIGS